MNRLKPSLVRQLFVLLLILFMLVLIFKEIIPYLSGVLGAITLHVVMRKYMDRLVEKGLETGFGLFIFDLLVICWNPGTYFAHGFDADFQNWKGSSKFRKSLASRKRPNQLKLEHYSGYDLSQSIDSARVANWLSNNLQSLGVGTFNAFISIGIMYFMLYYMLMNRHQLKGMMISYIPLGEDNLANHWRRRR